MRRVQSIFIPFLFALITFPAFVVLHECGHFAAGRLLGSRVEMHFAEVRSATPGGVNGRTNEALIAAAGPAVNLILGVAGFVWLRKLRESRRDASASVVDWIATCVALNFGRWLRGFSLPSNPQPADEVAVSQALALPACALPYCLALAALAVMIAVIGLHRRGDRLLPFSALFAGGIFGVEIWMRALGPLLLP